MKKFWLFEKLEILARFSEILVVIIWEKVLSNFIMLRQDRYSSLGSFYLTATNSMFGSREIEIIQQIGMIVPPMLN